MLAKVSEGSLFKNAIDVKRPTSNLLLFLLAHFLEDEVHDRMAKPFRLEHVVHDDFTCMYLLLSSPRSGSTHHTLTYFCLYVVRASLSLIRATSLRLHNARGPTTRIQSACGRHELASGVLFQYPRLPQGPTQFSLSLSLSTS